MTTEEQILIIAIEECAEVAQAISKAGRFGFDDIRNGQPYTNKERIEIELNDLFAAIELMTGNDISSLIDRDMIENKKEKVFRFIGYSKQKGIVKD